MTERQLATQNRQSTDSASTMTEKLTARQIGTPVRGTPVSATRTLLKVLLNMRINGLLTTTLSEVVLIESILARRRRLEVARLLRHAAAWTASPTSLTRRPTRTS